MLVHLCFTFAWLLLENRVCRAQFLWLAKIVHFVWKPAATRFFFFQDRINLRAYSCQRLVFSRERLVGDRCCISVRLSLIFFERTIIFSEGFKYRRVPQSLRSQSRQPLGELSAPRSWRWALPRSPFSLFLLATSGSDGRCPTPPPPQFERLVTGSTLPTGVKC